MPPYKQSSRSWMAKFRYKTWNGETKWVTKRGLPTKREAVQWEEDYKLRKSVSINMKLRDFVQVYREDKTPRLKESTLVTNENIIDSLFLL